MRPPNAYRDFALSAALLLTVSGSLVGCQSSLTLPPPPSEQAQSASPRSPSALSSTEPAAPPDPPPSLEEMLPEGSPELCGDLTPAKCAQRGYQYEHGSEKDIERAIKMYAAACRIGSALGCSNVAGTYAQGTALPHDEDRAEDLYHYACRAGFLTACHKLAFRRAAGCAGASPDPMCEETHISPSRSRDIINVDCERKSDWLACVSVAAELDGKDPSASEVYEKACRHGIGWGCHELGDSHAKRGGQDDEQAIEFHQKGCELDFASSCTKLGVSAEARDQPDQARRFLRRGCELGEWRACEILSALP